MTQYGSFQFLTEKQRSQPECLKIPVLNKKKSPAGTKNPGNHCGSFIVRIRFNESRRFSVGNLLKNQIIINKIQ